MTIKTVRNNIHTEENLEEYITEKLETTGDWVVSQNSHGFDPTSAIFLNDVVSYLEKSNDSNKKFIDDKKKSPNWEKNLLKTITDHLDQDGTIAVLRDGFKEIGYGTIYLCGNVPIDNTIAEQRKMYENNILRVMRQCRYKDDGGSDEIDLVFFINGIPVATAELKTELCQTVEDAIVQYINDRKPYNPSSGNQYNLLMPRRGAIVHFAISEDEIWMCTNLDSRKGMPVFLPFNKGYFDKDGLFMPNKPFEEGDDDYPTSYFWNDVCEKSSWIRIFHDFVFVERKIVKNEKGRLIPKEKQIFPRFHQWKCVSKILEDINKYGVGQHYLIEHSAGSGKTETISWTAYMLSQLKNIETKEDVFRNIVIVTDRINLDTNIKATIKQLPMNRTMGAIEMIGGDDVTRKSGAKKTQLTKAFEDGRKIIIVTLQTFPYAIEEIIANESLQGSCFAVLIDEAHSSQGGTAFTALNTALKEAGNPADEAEVTDEDVINEYFAEQQSNHVLPSNISYFAFTATPKDKTKTTFGRFYGKYDKDGNELKESFDLYPMRQAIEEGYILDVLKGYSHYVTLRNIQEKVKTDKPVDEKTARRSIAQWNSLHPTNVMEKAAFIVDHFMKNVVTMLGGEAKAMVVTSSRAAVIRYKRAMDAYIKAHPEYSPIMDSLSFKAPGDPLVAFSNKVLGKEAILDADNTIDFEKYGIKTNPFAAIKADYEYKEEDFNRLGQQTIEDAFESRERKILIVADKFQTGFNQPKLCAMYVDKKIGSPVEIVQTYSRLNRIYKNKEDVFIVDFVNAPDAVEKAFKLYDLGAEMQKAQDLNIIYQIKRRLDAADIYYDNDVANFKEVYYSAQRDIVNKNDKHDLRRKLYGAIIKPADKWNNLYQSYHNEERQCEEAIVKNPDSKDAMEFRLRQIQDELLNLRAFKRDLRKYYSSYNYISQVIDICDPDLEVFHKFVQLLSRTLRGAGAEDIDVKNLVLKDFRLSDPIHIEGKWKDPVLLHPMSAGNGKTVNSNNKILVEELLKKINSIFGEDSEPQSGAAVINVMADAMMILDPVLTAQIKNPTNSIDVILSTGRFNKSLKNAMSKVDEDVRDKLSKLDITNKDLSDLLFKVIREGHIDVTQLN
ncbi:type I restriction endonuclease [Butyrivibrio sp. WCD3002]|uniref:type I restriction endonuclease n=1 Tax=Butyrivibrio sp. WCD3002 TaxID=1280676 RepID=UPI0003F568A2|nr:type I restriction endonuclease [Butyrivibrio sp. WCD3002]